MNYAIIIMMQKRWQRILILLGLFGLAFVFLISTNPQKLPLIVLIIPFVYVFGLCYLTARMMAGKRYHNLTYKVIVFLMAVLPTLLLVLASIQQLTLKDVSLCVAITVILVWYLLTIKRS